MTLYTEPMLSREDVQTRLGISKARALQLLRVHGTLSLGRWLLPESALPALEARNTKRGRPRKTPLTAT